MRLCVSKDAQQVLAVLAFAGLLGQLLQLAGIYEFFGEGDLLALLMADTDVRKRLSAAELKENFDLGHHFKHVDTIFERVFGKAAVESAAGR